MKKVIVLILLLVVIPLSGCDIINPLDDTSIEFVLVDGQDTVEIHSEWIDAGAIVYVDSAWNNVGGIGTVDTSKIGLYEIEYSYEYLNNSYSVSRYVYVVDQTRPILSLNLGIDTIRLNEEWIDSGATVTDNSGETLTVTTIENVDATTTGTYEVVYTATDASGNTQSIIRYIYVLE